MNMKKLTSLTLVLVMVMALLAGCACKHEWKDAYCGAPKTCELCGETEGEATNDHQWEEATTDAPKTCKTCGKTEGEKIQVHELFQTSACKDLFGTWETVVEVDGLNYGMEGLKIPYSMTMTFTNDGHMTTTTKIQDMTTMTELVTDYLEQSILDIYAGQGYSAETAEKIIQQTYGMSIKEYAQQSAQDVMATIADTTTIEEALYYVADGKIYAGDSYYKAMDPVAFTLEDSKLVLNYAELGQVLEFTKVEQ